MVGKTPYLQVVVRIGGAQHALKIHKPTYLTVFSYFSASVSGNNITPRKMDKMIYDKEVHEYLIRRFNESLVSKQIHFGKLLDELNFTLESSYLSKPPYPHYIQVQFPDISNEWITKQFSYEKLSELLEKNINPRIIYAYSFFFIDENIKSLILNWLMSAKDLRLKNILSEIMRELTTTLNFLNQNCTNADSLNIYLDLWVDTIDNIANRDSNYLINGIRFGDYINRDEYYAVQALISSNKK